VNFTDQEGKQRPEFWLTQTSLKDLEKDTTCPDRWRGLWLDKEFAFQSNEAMDKGKYFEWMSLGGGAITGEDVTDLPRTSTGKKTIDQVRIEEQAARFMRLFDPKDPEFQGFQITATQIEMKHNGRKGTIDFNTIKLDDKSVWINDLKLTADLTSTRSQYGWGHDWANLDLVQMIHYQDMYEQLYGITPRVGMWVFDYSPEKRVKFGEIVISKKARQKKELRFESAFEVITLYEKNGWVKLPSEFECKNCPLACSERYKEPAIERIVVNI
jgi:hypothetical protein